MIDVSYTSRELAREAVADFQFWLATRSRRRTAKPKPAKTVEPTRQYQKGDNTPTVIAWLKAQAEPQTVEAIAEATGLKVRTVRDMLNRNKDVFERAGKIQRERANIKLWKVAG